MNEIALEAMEEQTNLISEGDVEYKRAVEIHCQVMIAREQVCDGLLNIAKSLKAMRDGKLYKQLGYSDFDDYIERGVNIGKRQVYNYISTYERLGPDVLQSNAQLGITKLALLTAVSDIERADFIAQNDLNGMSVKEIEALIKKSEKQSEQISMLTSEIEELKAEQVEFINTAGDISLSEELERVRTELAQLKTKPVDVAVEQVSDADIEKIRLQAEETIKAEYEKSRKADIEIAVEAVKRKVEEREERKLKAAEERAAEVAALQVEEAKRKVAEEYKKSIAAMEAEKAAAAERAEQLARELLVANDADMTTVQFLMDEFTEVFTKLTSKISEVQDGEKSHSLFGAVEKILVVLTEQVNSMVSERWT